MTPEIYRWRIRCRLDRHPCQACDRPLEIGDDAIQIDGIIYCPDCEPKEAIGTAPLAAATETLF